MNDNNLKNCPFCGFDCLSVMELMTGGYCVFCNTCLTYGPMAETKEKAIEKWNERKEKLQKYSTRPCWWYGKPAKFHMWSHGVPFHSFSHAGAPKECTIGILEDEDGKIVNARPEDIRFTDSLVE